MKGCNRQVENRIRQSKYAERCVLDGGDVKTPVHGLGSAIEKFSGGRAFVRRLVDKSMETDGIVTAMWYWCMSMSLFVRVIKQAEV